MPEPRQLAAPWTIEEHETAFIVRTSNGFVVSLTYFESNPKSHRTFNLTKDEARRVAKAISQIPEMMGKDKTHG